jgi:drug/metabolite transporter (DMT)-like permease
MDGAQVLVPILVPISLFAMVFGLVYLKSRENLSMIEKGMNPKEFANRPAPYRNLKNGLLLLGAGIGLALAYIITKYVLHDEENPALWFALIGIGGGLGLISSYKIEKKELLDNRID